MNEHNQPLDPLTTDQITPDPHNPNQGTEAGGAMLQQSMEDAGAGRSILVDKAGRIIAGNTTMATWRKVNPEAPVHVVETTGEELVVVQRTDLDLEDATTPARRLSYLDNRSSEVGLEWDVQRIMDDINAGLDFGGIFDPSALSAMLADLPTTLPGDPGPDNASDATRQSLVSRFIVPPFSVRDTRQGFWQAGKRTWLAVGMKCAVGGGGDIVPNGTRRPLEHDGAFRRQGRVSPSKASHA